MPRPNQEGMEWERDIVWPGATMDVRHSSVRLPPQPLRRNEPAFLDNQGTNGLYMIRSMEYEATQQRSIDEANPRPIPRGTPDSETQSSFNSALCFAKICITPCPSDLLSPPPTPFGSDSYPTFRSGSLCVVIVLYSQNTQDRWCLSAPR
ncbi:hypothetical protein BT67DRAFT_208385 [Trichocladium antarcticum]|uniref:Uncharacterized protein n=1 Tax=Trichocladium antarcticum TaxID=1450529 RepID=A0AAN6UFJ8_9PEZI|nr:hypothetical protein BT67DRAFT_208385 [Trichocladium antarcticum]